MAGDPRRYDNAFYSIIQNEGNIDGFLDAVYGFLYRGTDFYKIMTETQTKMGFRPGVAERKTMQHFKKYEKMARADDEKDEKLRKKADEEQRKKLEAEAALKAAADITAKQTESKSDNTADSESSQQATEANHVSQSEAKAEEVPPLVDEIEVPPLVDEIVVDDVSDSELAKIPDTNPALVNKARFKEDEDDPELTRLQKEFQSKPESYNGADRGTYVWSQSISDCDVRVRIPKHITKGKDVSVMLERKHIKVSAKTEAGDWQVLLDDDLNWEINLEESIWSMVPHEHVHINVEKVKERWWEAVFVSEPHISVRKIDPSRPITDLDDEAQAKIQEMMYNEHQKRLGKPQSHEVKVHNILEKAWNLEGSPFQGTPFDPTKLNIAPPGGSC